MCNLPPRKITLTSAINPPATILLAGITFIGGFSRLTSGQYTPGWYAYQLDRAGNTTGTIQGWLIPLADVALGTLLLSRRTRRSAAVATTAFFGLGLWMRVASGKGFVTDAALFGLAVLVLGTS
ncbi:hypothetical protein K438DRAFT_1814752 [Mycena galopus ATCC 62051]|nr:hypothetical protein K438DRAFT_1814752 [Mycena galopus ATCC 62051]